MAPIVIITIPCENKPCNVTNTLIRLVNNLTSTENPEGANGDYDHHGAARFIIATVLVYSLMGVFGMLLLRIKRSASKSRRSTSTREETVLRYIKKTDRLMLEARRAVMKRETGRTLDRLNYLRQKSDESSNTCSSNPGEFSLSNSLNLSTSFNSSQFRMPYSPTPTSVSLLMPLLPVVQETPAENANSSSQSDGPKVVFHFPALPPLTIPHSMVVAASPSPPSNYLSLSPTSTSTPVTLVTGLNFLPSSNVTTAATAATTLPTCAAAGMCEESPVSKSSSRDNNNIEDVDLKLSFGANTSDNNNEKCVVEPADDRQCSCDT